MLVGSWRKTSIIAGESGMSICPKHTNERAHEMECRCQDILTHRRKSGELQGRSRVQDGSRTVLMTA